MPFPCCCTEAICQCDQPVAGWQGDLAANAWTWTGLRYIGGRLELSAGVSGGFASGTQQAIGLLPGAQYVLLIDESGGDFGYWVEINGQRAFSATGDAWQFAESGIFSLDPSGSLRFTAPGPTVTIRFGLTSADSRLASDFPRVTGSEGQGNAIASICLCAVCTVQVTSLASCRYRAEVVSEVPPGVTQYQWRVRLCALTEFVIPTCTNPVFSGNTSVPVFDWEFVSAIAGSRRGGRVDVTMRDANNTIVSYCEVDFTPQCNTTCCRDGLPEEVQVTSGGWVPKLGPFTPVLQEWQFTAAEHLNAAHVCDLVHVAGTAASPIYRYHGPGLTFVYPNIASRVPAEWQYRAMALARAELNCGSSRWSWAAEVVAYADFLTESELEALLSNAIAVPTQLPPSWQSGVDLLFSTVDRVSNTGNASVINANCIGVNVPTSTTFETNNWFVSNKTASLTT